MRVVIVNAYVREGAGDAALLHMCVEHIREAFGDVQIVIAGMEDPNRHPTFEGVQNVGSMRRSSGDESVPRMTRLLRKAVMVLLYAACWRPRARMWRSLTHVLPREIRSEFIAIVDADLAVSVGGGYLSGTNNAGATFNVLALLLPLTLAERANVTLALAPQSYGPFGNRWQRLAAVRAIDGADIAMERESVSARALDRAGARHERRLVVPDSAFCLPELPGDRASNRSLGDTLRIGITARNWRNPAVQRDYEDGLAELAAHSVERHDADVTLIAHATAALRDDDDGIVTERIRNSCAAPVRMVRDQLDYQEIRHLYAQLDVLVGTRMHSVIFALISRVPCLAIAYEPKTIGLMRDLGLEQWVVSIEDATAKRLIPLLDDLITQRAAYQSHLSRVLPGYTAKAREVPSLLRRAMND